MITKKRMGRPLTVLRWSPLLKISNHLVIDFSKNPIAHTLVFSERGDLNKVLIDALDYYATAKGHPASTKEFQVKTVSSGVGLPMPSITTEKSVAPPVDFIAPVQPSTEIKMQTQPEALAVELMSPKGSVMPEPSQPDHDKPRALSSFLQKQLSG